MNNKLYLNKRWLTGQALLLEAMNANQRVIKDQVVSEYSFDQLIKELNK